MKTGDTRNEKGQFVKGIIPKTAFKKGHIGHKVNLGKKFPNRKSPPPFTEDHRKKIGLNGFHYGMKGKKHTEETKRKMSEIHKGKPNPWNKGKPSPMLGKHHSKESLKKMSEIHKGKHFSPNTEFKNGIIPKNSKIFQKGQHASPTTEFKKGHKLGIGRHYSEETKKKMRESHINNPNRIFKDTSIELKIEEELKRRGINYQKQVPLCKVAIVDFYLPEYRIVIQCDGDYWHNIPKNKERDEHQNAVLIFNGFNVYRFWEHEINRSVKECINRIQLEEFLKN